MLDIAVTRGYDCRMSNTSSAMSASHTKYHVGQTVEVSTTYSQTGIMRDRAGQWLPKGEWRRAMISSVSAWSDRTNYYVQFEEGGCNWLFAECEIRPITCPNCLAGDGEGECLCAEAM